MLLKILSCGKHVVILQVLIAKTDFFGREGVRYTRGYLLFELNPSMQMSYQI